MPASDVTVSATFKEEPKPIYTITDGSDTWTKGSGKDLTFTVRRTLEGEDEDTAYDHFVSVSVADKAREKDVDYTAEKGSVKIAIKSSYLEKLDVSKHAIAVVFDDGKADTSVTVAKAKEYPKPTMSNSKGGNFAAKTDEITYTINQEVPDWATSVKTWVDLESVLQYTVDKDGVTVTSDGAPVQGAAVTIDGQKLTVSIADATSLRGKTFQVAYKAKLHYDANLDPYLNPAKNTASVPYQAHTVFDDEQDKAVESTSEAVKFRVSDSGGGTGEKKSDTPAPKTEPLGKTGDPTAATGMLAATLAGVGFLGAGRIARRRH